MKIFSTFTGIGGFELGINNAYEKLFNLSKTEGEQQGRITQDSPHADQSSLELQQPTYIGYSEIDPYAIKTYQSHFPDTKNYGDITKIKTEDLPEFDMLVGGFPCQSFSIAGKRGGFADTRGTLFFDIARIVKDKQPRLLLLENVKGLLSHNKGDTFRTIITTLDELGYDLQWQVLNSKNFGVPQHRERVFIVGNLRGTSRPKVFPLESSYGTNEVEINILAHKDFYRRANQVFARNGITETISTSQGGGQHACTLQPMGQHAIARRLTPKEYERLQGFSDNWTLGSDTQRYKQCGNAVTKNVIEQIMERLLV